MAQANLPALASPEGENPILTPGGTFDSLSNWGRGAQTLGGEMPILEQKRDTKKS